MTTRTKRKSTGGIRRDARYVICIDNSGYEASLEKAKLYRVLPDPEGATRGLIRVLDETGEDYLFDTERFLPIRLTETIRRAISTSTKGRG